MKTKMPNKKESFGDRLKAIDRRSLFYKSDKLIEENNNFLFIDKLTAEFTQVNEAWENCDRRSLTNLLTLTNEFAYDIKKLIAHMKIELRKAKGYDINKI